MIEQRAFVFKDHAGNVIARTYHDTSKITSTINKGDEVYDKCIYPSGHTDVISGIVQRSAFDYINNTVVIYVKID